MRVAVLANLKKNAPRWNGMSEDQWDDLDSEKTINAIVESLRACGHQVEFLEASIWEPHNLIRNLGAYQPDICFNIAESHFGDGREAQIPALLEMLRIPYTGSKVLALALALDKPMTKRILHYHGLPTPEFQVFERADAPIDDDLLNGNGDLRYSMFVKPSREGTSIGVSVDSIVRKVDELRAQVAVQLARYNQPILVEHYIGGREVTVGMLGNLKPTESRHLSERAANHVLPETLTFLPILEMDTNASGDTDGDVYTSRMKTELGPEDYKYFCPAPLTREQEHDLKVLAGAVFRVIGCKDVSRVDFRLDAMQDDKPYILEINPLPGLSPGFSDICLQAEAAGMSYAELINAILMNAAKRYGLVEEAMAVNC
jgi:D-alanine-D-alanine ligase